MALRAVSSTTSITRPSPPCKHSNGIGKAQAKHSSIAVLPTASTTAVSLLALFSTPGLEAKAFTFPKEDILSSLSKVEGTVDQVGRVIDSGFSAFNSLIDALKPTVDVAAPVVQRAGEGALKIASPLVSEVTKQAQESLQNAGLDTAPLISAAKTVVDAAGQSTKVIEVAKPIASATFETLYTYDPSVLAGGAGALFLLYLLTPPIWSALSFNFRGYKGNLSPAQALDLVSAQNYFLIDIRSEKDKSKAGIPRLPSSDKNKLISLPLEELPTKIRGLVKDGKKVEAEIVAIKISYLKKLNKGSNIAIIDSYADTAKTVAKTLTALGFKNVWVVADGFSGSRGWVQSRLGSDSYDTPFAEVLSPSRIIPAGLSRFGTTSSSQRLLPGNVD